MGCNVMPTCKTPETEWSLEADTELLMGVAYSIPLDEIAEKVNRPVLEVVLRLKALGLLSEIPSKTID